VPLRPSITDRIIRQREVYCSGVLLGSIGQGYEPMQLRLRTRRLEMGARAIGMTQRALDMTVEHALQRITFGVGVLRSRRWSTSAVRATSVSGMSDARRSMLAPLVR
jgi:alkylation response protein AidB-like acyl-CoA dehydrogenase